MLIVLLPVHIVAGGLAIILGGIALAASKGATLHRRSGLLFVYAMLTMGISGSILALRLSLTNANVLGGFMSAYFVITALTTVRPVSTCTRWVNAVALAVAISLSLIEIGLGLKAFSNPGGTLQGVPFFMLFFMATITTLAAAGDVRMMRSGTLRAAPRLARHLWRMCFALFIAAGSFFSIRARVAKILPWPFTTPAMRALPVALVFAAMFYWLWRVRSRRVLSPPWFPRPMKASGD
ncbi:MAG: hypothetical protein ABSH09_08215 [Bryobacteraceae bacterium]|jgi:uncharacterized membrane protein